MAQANTVAFEFIADRPVVDFVATVASRGSSPLEKLSTPADLARWIRGSGIVHNRLDPSDADLERTATLREAMFRLISARINRTRASAADRHLVNRVASNPPPISQLTASGQVYRTGDLDALLAHLATDCIELFHGRDGDLMSWCADPTCTRPFIDRSRGQRRRWCDMKGCGDRAKAASYRQRRHVNASWQGVDALRAST